MIMKSNSKICRFDINPYGLLLMVTTTDAIKELPKIVEFCQMNDFTEINENGYDAIVNTDDYYGVTIPIKEKSTGRFGVLTVFDPKSPDLSGTIAHESVHVADYIWQKCTMYFEDFTQGNEPYAYMVGWAAGKISDCIINRKRCR